MSKTAIYTRISRSDDNSYNISIENQIKGITDYCNSHHLNIVKTYKDIGYSGGNFNRPGFKEMLNDIDSGIIDTIVVKDLSRFGRNHLEVGTYLDEIFLINNIRFIAIDDNYDNKGLMDEFSTFKNIFNEMYLKDIRRKIRSTFDYKAKTKLLNPRPGVFYGLTVDDSNNIVIDEYAASIVRRIFDLYINGCSTNGIAYILTKEQVVSPGHYRNIKYNDKSGVKNDNQYKWKNCTIYKIITNEEYTGKIINRKYLNINGKRMLNPDPIIIEGGLPQIIDDETFNKAQEVRLERPKKKDKVYINPYPDIVRCGCCNKLMRYTYSKTMDKYLYTCRRCKTRIYLDDLKLILVEDIKAQITKINDVEVISYNEKNIKIIKRDIKLIEVKIQKCFEDYTKGDITEEKLKATMEELTKEKSKIALNLDKGLKQVKTTLSQVSKCKIDDGLILKLITNVSVVNIGKRKYNVHINYNFKNQINGAKVENAPKI